ncbi:aldehyde dehydrogenase [candidate division KSB1 bacterium]|nr:aldehyde dehydrogenase [candidate division KSB1 bacterium]
MLRIGINGFGRIGRAIFRNNIKKNAFKVVALNDINPDINNIAYQLNYDTLYGPLDEKYYTVNDHLCTNQDKIKVYHKQHVDAVPWENEKVDFVIDASGVLDNVLRAPRTLVKHNLKKVLITHSPEEVDFSMVLGANEKLLDLTKQHVLSTSICDATALGPVLTLIQEKFGIKNGYITTLHPWLNYQNLMDGPASSWSVPGTIYHHYTLGRSVIGNMIPKPTSAISATCKVVQGVTEEMIGSFSYRTPTAIVGSADITLNLQHWATKEEVLSLFVSAEKRQRWNIIRNNFEPLTSLDYKNSDFSAVVDHRWTDVLGNDLLKLVLWYDNEWGYSARVLDQVLYIEEKMREQL